MSTTPSYVEVCGFCKDCLRTNTEHDRNFCENKIRSEKCELLKV